MKPRPRSKSKTRRHAIRDIVPPDVPEVISAPAPAVTASNAESDPIPEHIRKMLEAAYT